jgi:Trk K+ transport system NAD-binding subunit
VGYGRLWKYIAAKLQENQIPFCIIENDIKKVESAEQAWYETIYGDLSDNDTLLSLITHNTELVYSTVDNFDTNLQLLTLIKDTCDFVKVVVVASYLNEAEWLYQQWSADYVVFPHLSWATESWDVLEKHVAWPEQFILSKIKNMQALQQHKSHVMDT